LYLKYEIVYTSAVTPSKLMPISTQLSPFSISVKLSLPPPLELVGAVYVGEGVAVTGAAAIGAGAAVGSDDTSMLSIILIF
jgi:hypothetical protein